MKITTLIAFWSYDLYPFYLSGKVAKLDEERGLVYIEGYQSWFRPKLILPDREGEDLARGLQMLRDEYESEVEDLRADYTKKLNLLGYNLAKGDGK